ncbi:MAG TPA: 16S rRNA (guanine(527)-N(7))-methyltransferase RsmG, partial [Nitrosopumilaceae archaeon]|nr:16S rRNA (guanine(527)-N(7))-methyltransferase RsmG [Nitrosopumilaceae archaeon]
FPDLSEEQQKQFDDLQDLYTHWNAQINVISRKDIDLLYERHVLHSLGIAKIIQFKPNTKLLDVGTGGGFPGIPLAIMFPKSSFHLVDGTGKKIKVVKAITEALNLKNVFAEQARAESIHDKFDFILSRAVAEFPVFFEWVKGKLLRTSFNSLPNGILYLKGGDLNEELKEFQRKVKLYELSKYFKEEFFETKKVVYLPG